MSLLTTILEKLGLGTSSSAGGGASSSSSVANSAASATQSAAVASTPPAAAVKPVDVTAKLDQLASSSAQKLNWRTSIVDLLKLLNMDSSLESRKKLAQELGYHGTLDGSAEMNKAVLQKLADNGGNIPKELL